MIWSLKVPGLHRWREKHYISFKDWLQILPHIKNNHHGKNGKSYSSSTKMNKKCNSQRHSTQILSHIVCNFHLSYKASSLSLKKNKHSIFLMNLSRNLTSIKNIHLNKNCITYSLDTKTYTQRIFLKYWCRILSYICYNRLFNYRIRHIWDKNIRKQQHINQMCFLHTQKCIYIIQMKLA